MPYVAPDDVAAAIRVKWLAATANALIPVAKVHQGRASEDTALPYANLLVEPGGVEGTSGSSFLAKFTVTVEAYTAANPPDTLAVQQALHLALLGRTQANNAGLVIAAANVIWSRPLPSPGPAVTTVRVDGKDVLKTTVKLELLIQGYRN